MGGLTLGRLLLESLDALFRRVVSFSFWTGSSVSPGDTTFFTATAQDDLTPFFHFRSLVDP